jgi:hypothetical protein
MSTGSRALLFGLVPTLLLVLAAGPQAMALSAWDCKAVGGTVITVTDGRCGASGQYCRMPDTNAVCIAKAAAQDIEGTPPPSKVRPKLRPGGVLQRAP